MVLPKYTHVVESRVYNVCVSFQVIQANYTLLRVKDIDQYIKSEIKALFFESVYKDDKNKSFFAKLQNKISNFSTGRITL